MALKGFIIAYLCYLCTQMPHRLPLDADTRVHTPATGSAAEAPSK